MVFFFVLKSQDPRLKFDLTIFPKQVGSEDKLSLADATFEIRLHSGYLPGDNTKECTVKFTDIPFEYYKNDSVELSILNENKWVFSNEKKIIKIQLTEDEEVIPLKVDTTYLSVAGIFYLKGKPMAKAKVSYVKHPACFTYTSETGSFALRFNEKATEEMVSLQVKPINSKIRLILIKMGTQDFSHNFNDAQ